MPAILHQCGHSADDGWDLSGRWQEGVRVEGGSGSGRREGQVRVGSARGRGKCEWEVGGREWEVGGASV